MMIIILMLLLVADEDLALAPPLKGLLHVRLESVKRETTLVSFCACLTQCCAEHLIRRSYSFFLHINFTTSF